MDAISCSRACSTSRCWPSRERTATATTSCAGYGPPGLEDVGDASVYGTLRRLYSAGALTSYVVPSDEGPHRKYYGINDRGRRCWRTRARRGGVRRHRRRPSDRLGGSGVTAATGVSRQAQDYLAASSTNWPTSRGGPQRPARGPRPPPRRAHRRGRRPSARRPARPAGRLRRRPPRVRRPPARGGARGVATWAPAGRRPRLGRVRRALPAGAIRRLLVELRPAWWVLRGYLVCWCPACSAGLRRGPPRAGADAQPPPRGAPRPRRRGRVGDPGPATSAAVGVVVAAAGCSWSWPRSASRTASDDIRVRVYADAWAPGPEVPAEDYPLLSRYGPVTDVFPYAADGTPLEGVLLYDQDGRPLKVGFQQWWADRCARVLDQPQAADGVAVPNSYPQSYVLDPAGVDLSRSVPRPPSCATDVPGPPSPCRPSRPPQSPLTPATDPAAPSPTPGPSWGVPPSNRRRPPCAAAPAVQRRAPGVLSRFASCREHEGTR